MVADKYGVVFRHITYDGDPYWRVATAYSPEWPADLELTYGARQEQIEESEADMRLDPTRWSLPREFDSREGGLCMQTDPDLFYPKDGDNGWEGKAVCRRCPLMEECLTGAFERKETYGIWGGRNFSVRARQKAKAKAAAAELATKSAVVEATSDITLVA